MGNRQKVLMVTGSLRIGGMENVAMNILRYIDQEKFDVRFVVYGDEIGEYEEEVKQLGGEVYRIPFPHEGSLKYCKALRKVMRTTGPYAVVHSHNLFPSGMVMLVAKQERVPVRIAHAHTNRDDSNINLIRRLYQWVMRRFMIKNATALVACSKRAGVYLFQGVFANAGYVMNNGVDADKFQISQEIVVSLKSEFGITDEKIIGHTGRFVEVKNHMLLIDVFKSICDEGENVRLLLIGDGPLRETVEQKAKECGIFDKVIFTGMRNDVPALLSLMDVYVLPSTYEGVSVSLMEAQAAGVPFVVSTSAYSSESRVTEYGFELNLNDSIESWRDVIVKQMQRGKLQNPDEIIRQKGYDTESIIRYIQDNYYSSPKEDELI